MFAHARRGSIAAVLALLLIAVLFLQARTDALAPTGVSDVTGRAIGRAGFAYLTGIRTYAAAVLWNRLDPIGDTYYGTKTLQQQTFVLPTIHLVVTLDPQFTQGYYVAAWILFERGQRARGLALAREGVRNNPRSGIMIAQLSQLLLFLRDKGPNYLSDAEKWADVGTRENIVWTDDTEKFEGYATFRVVYELTGQKVKAAAVRAELVRLKASGSVNTTTTP